MRKRHDAGFKAKVALEAIRENKTMSELSSQHGIHRVQIQKWKKQLVTNAASTFATKKDASKAERQEQLLDELYQQIGRQKMEIDWIKKKCEDLGC